MLWSFWRKGVWSNNRLEVGLSNNEDGDVIMRMVSSGEVWEVMWGGPVRPGSGGTGRSGREPWAPEGKVL